MNTDELLEEANRFITGISHSADSGFAKQKRAVAWCLAYDQHISSRRLTAAPPPDGDCPTCSRPMESHTVRTPDQRTRIITCPL